MKFSPLNMMRGAESVSIVTMCSRVWERVFGRIARMSVVHSSADATSEALRTTGDGAGRFLVEIEHRPVVRPRHRAQSQIWVDRGRMADDGEHRVIGEAVGVRPRLREIDLVRGR